MAITDNLTGIANRRHVIDLASREFTSSLRYRRPLGAILFDVDRFKRINDTWGHGVGDEVLREIVHRCRDALRAPDVFGRFGGRSSPWCCRRRGSRRRGWSPAGSAPPSPPRRWQQPVPRCR